jgi:hypothetical protein
VLHAPAIGFLRKAWIFPVLIDWIGVLRSGMRLIQILYCTLTLSRMGASLVSCFVSPIRELLYLTVLNVGLQGWGFPAVACRNRE